MSNETLDEIESALAKATTLLNLGVAKIEQLGTVNAQMLAALKLAEADIVIHLEDLGYEPDGEDADDPTLVAVRAAISKAEGRS